MTHEILALEDTTAFSTLGLVSTNFSREVRVNELGFFSSVYGVTNTQRSLSNVDIVRTNGRSSFKKSGTRNVNEIGFFVTENDVNYLYEPLPLYLIFTNEIGRNVLYSFDKIQEKVKSPSQIFSSETLKDFTLIQNGLYTITPAPSETTFWTSAYGVTLTPEDKVTSIFAGTTTSISLNLDITNELGQDTYRLTDGVITARTLETTSYLDDFSFLVSRQNTEATERPSPRILRASGSGQMVEKNKTKVRVTNNRVFEIINVDSAVSELSQSFLVGTRASFYTYNTDTQNLVQ